MESKKRERGPPAGQKISWNRNSQRVCAVKKHKCVSFTIQDENSGRRLLVDTGAFVSLYPSCMTYTALLDKRDIPELIAANGSKIPTYGCIKISL